MDEDYAFKRTQRRAKKPKNVVEGCSTGCGSIGFGLAECFGGILCKPCTKVKNGEGAKGFFGQLARGMVGLIIKPVVGGIDYISQSSEGIKGTTQLGSDKARMEKMREPRVFYGFLQRIKDYKLVDAMTNSVLRKDLAEVSRDDIYLMCFEFWEADISKFDSNIHNKPLKGYIDNKDMKKMYVALTMQRVMCYYESHKSNSVVWVANCQDITHIQEINGMISITAKDENNEDARYSVTCTNLMKRQLLMLALQNTQKGIDKDLTVDDEHSSMIFKSHGGGVNGNQNQSSNYA